MMGDMLPRKAALATFVLAASSLAAAGCAPTVADGARSVFSTTHICPASAITVTTRSDLAPHSVLKGVTPPPGVDLDSVGSTYEISGCNQKVLFVCGRPVVGKTQDPFSAGFAYADDGVHLDLNTDYFAITRALDESGGRVSTVVVCQPGSQTGG
jgi:hypothetical protein